MKKKIPIVKKNDSKIIYEIEKKIRIMIDKEMEMEKINYEIKKLKKYNYSEYIKQSIQLIKKNPKKYHKGI